MRLVFSAIGLLVTAASSWAQEGGAASDRLSFALDVGTGWESNINFGGDEVDPLYASSDAEFDDLTTSLGGTVSYAFMQDAGSELTGSATLFYNHVNDFDDLSNQGVSVGLAYRGEFGPAFTDPWYSFGVDYSLVEYDDSRIRDGDLLDVEVMIGKRLNPKWGIAGGYRYHKRGQDNSTGLCPTRTNVNCPGTWREYEVFDQERWSLFAHIDWFVADKVSLFLQYSYWEGEEDSTLPLRGGRTPGWRNNQDIFADDPAFGLSTFLTGPNPAMIENIVWKVDVQSYAAELGLRYAVADNITIELVGVFLETTDVESADRPAATRQVDNYRNTVVTASATFAF